MKNYLLLAVVFVLCSSFNSIEGKYAYSNSQVYNELTLFADSTIIVNYHSNAGWYNQHKGKYRLSGDTLHAHFTQMGHIPEEVDISVEFLIKGDSLIKLSTAEQEKLALEDNKPFPTKYFVK